MAKKNGDKLTRAGYLRMAALAGADMRFAMAENPGLIFDMFELYIEANNGGKGAADDGGTEDYDGFGG